MGWVRPPQTVACGVLACAILSACAGSAAAQSQQAPAGEDAKRKAREAYHRGEAALEREEYSAAAGEFVYADELVPNDAALQAAFDALAKTQDAKTAVKLLNRLERRANASAPVAAAAARARAKLDPLVGRIVLECPAGHGCRAELDNAPAASGTVVWALPGTHWLRSSLDGGPMVEDGVDLKAGDLVSVPLGARRAPLVTEVPDPNANRGPSPVFFWVGLGVTAVIVGFATWSTIDLYQRGKDVTQCETRKVACPDLVEKEDSAGSRTVALWAVSAGAAVLTAATGLFIVDWKGGQAKLGQNLGIVVEQRF